MPYNFHEATRFLAVIQGFLNHLYCNTFKVIHTVEVPKRGRVCWGPGSVTCTVHDSREGVRQQALVSDGLQVFQEFLRKAVKAVSQQRFSRGHFPRAFSRGNFPDKATSERFYLNGIFRKGVSDQKTPFVKLGVLRTKACTFHTGMW